MRNTARRSLKIAVTSVAALAVMVGTAACGTPSGGGGDADAPLTFWSNDVEHEDDWNAAMAAFTEQSGIPVEISFYQNDQFKQQIANATGTDTMPDVFTNWSGIGLIGNIYEAGALQDMSEYYDQYGWDDRFSETGIASITLDGAKMGVPFQVQEMAVVYQKAVFEAQGITPPTTFEELEAVNEQLLAAGITPWSFAGKNSWDTMRLADVLLETTCGAEEFDALRGLEADWSTSDCAVEGFQTFRDWIDKGYLVPDYMALDPNAREMYTAILDGKAAMTIDGNWSGGGLVELGQNPDDWSYFPFPTGTDRLNYFATSLYQSSTSKNPDAAAELIDFLTQKETVEQFRGVLNGAIGAMNGYEAADGATEYDKGWIALGAQFTGNYGPSDQAFPPDVASSFLLSNDQLQLGQLDPQATVEAIQTAADLYKAENG